VLDPDFSTAEETFAGGAKLLENPIGYYLIMEGHLLLHGFVLMILSFHPAGATR